MNNKRIIIVVVAILLIGLGVYAFTRKNVTTNEPVEQLPDVAQRTDVKTYKSDKYGIEFSYPNGYVLTEKETGTAKRARHTITLMTEADAAALKSANPPGEQPTGITIDIFQNNLDKEDIEHWLENNSASNFKLSDGNVSPVTVASTTAIAYSWDGLYPTNSIIFSHKDNIVMMSMTYLTAKDAVWRDFATIIQKLKLY